MIEGKWPLLDLIASMKGRLIDILHRQGATEQQYGEYRTMQEIADVIGKHFGYSIDAQMVNNEIDQLPTGTGTLQDTIQKMILESNAYLEVVGGYESYYKYCCQDMIALMDAPRLPNNPIGSLAYAFSSCYNVRRIDLGDCGEVTSLDHAFAYCQCVDTIIIGNMSKVQNIDRWLTYCKAKRVVIETVGHYDDWTYVEGYGWAKGDLVDLSSLTNMNWNTNEYGGEMLFQEVTLYMPNLKSTIQLHRWGHIVHLICPNLRGWHQTVYGEQNAKFAVYSITGIQAKNIPLHTTYHGANNGLNQNNNQLTHIEFAEGSYMQDALGIYLTNLDAESIRATILQAYDWHNNPDGLAWPTKPTYNDSALGETTGQHTYVLSQKSRTTLVNKYGEDVIEELRGILTSRSNIEHYVNWQIELR